MVQVQFVVGNTYSRLRNQDAPYDRSGKYRKIHDWTLFVDLVSDTEPDWVESVKFDMNHSSFQPSVFTCTFPIQAVNANGHTVWRFQTRQQTYGPTHPIVTVRGRGGTGYSVSSYKLTFARGGGISMIHDFEESRRFREFRPNQIHNSFGVELELTVGSHATLGHVADTMSSRSGNNVEVLGYGEGRYTSNNWKLVPDSSIVCSTSSPNCNTFELVSPVLYSGEGLNECYKVLDGLDQISSVKVNKSMGFHVHVNVEGIKLAGLKKICQNFVKYEDAIDTLMPPSRRTGSDESSRYFKSSKEAMSQNYLTNLSRNRAIAACRSVKSLCTLMNPDGRYYKLNLDNLKTGRQPTIEFRQHSGTFEYKKLKSWVLFCLAFVHNSTRLPAPSALKEGTKADNAFEKLFQFVIKDRFLLDYYRKRKAHLQNDDEACSSCCNECSRGYSCQSHTNNRTIKRYRS